MKKLQLCAISAAVISAMSWSVVTADEHGHAAGDTTYSIYAGREHPLVADELRSLGIDGNCHG